MREKTDLTQTAGGITQNTAKSYSRTESQIITDTAQGCIYSFAEDDLMNPQYCAGVIVHEIHNALDLENSIRAKGDKMRIPRDLPANVIALLFSARNDVALIAQGIRNTDDGEEDAEFVDKSKLPIAIYQTDGLNKGVWQVCEDAYGIFGELVEQYKPSASKKDKQEVYISARNKLRIVRKCVIPHYVAVGNGIVDVKEHKLLPFSPDIVFTAKIRTNMNLASVNPVISTPDGDWDVESWMQSLAANEPELCNVLWEIIQAACLPLAPRHKMVMLYSESGNNGKGTLCELIRTEIGRS